MALDYLAVTAVFGRVELHYCWKMEEVRKR